MSSLKAPVDASSLRTHTAHLLLFQHKRFSIVNHIYVAIFFLSLQQGVCVFVAALIHYFYLAGFAWMLFEGVICI